MKYIMTKGAIISDCGNYRYQLWRKWDPIKPMALFIMLNPSTADANNDDPTIRRCVEFAKSWGYGGVYVGNLYAYRSTDRDVLKKVLDPEGPENQQNIQDMIESCSLVICAWGNKEGSPPLWLTELCSDLHYLELSKSGTPKHPLYLPGYLEPIKYENDIKT